MTILVDLDYHKMRIGLFIPCYVDQFYPHVGRATLRLLQKLDYEVHYPLDQTCCGQPLANSGLERDAVGIYHNMVRNFKDYDFIVAPSGSCVLHVREHYDVIEQTDQVKNLRTKIFELSEFLVDIARVDDLDSHFPHKVGFHPSCHALRGMRIQRSSETVGEDFSKARQLLEKVRGLELVDLDRVDECCGFGGTFSVFEEDISVSMGNDRIRDHLKNGVEVITGNDMSCLMHLEGLAKRQKLNIRIKHLVEILVGDESD